MTQTPRTPGLLGRLPAKPVGERFDIKYVSEYARQPFPAPVYPIDVTGGLTEWQMFGNDNYGDCTFAGFWHNKMAKAACENITETWPTDEEVVTDYLAYTGGQDVGANMADLLLFWFQSGKVEAFAPVDHTKAEELDSAMAAFHGAYVGVTLTDEDQQRFSEGEEWKVSKSNGPDSSLGHCVVKVQSSGHLWDGNHDTYVTWAALQAASKAWTAECVEEAWVIITAEDAEAVGLDLDALKKDIRALRGTQ